MQQDEKQSGQMTAAGKIQHIAFTAAAGTIELYTTLLQSGIVVTCPPGITLGLFLQSLPGFDEEYIVNRIQTLFLDGSAVDDMETVFTTANPVLALSAAMPGLAGAIFRKNSLHAALRSVDSKPVTSRTSEGTVRVLLKLFNMIAIEKGPGILARGGIFSGDTLIEFFQRRKSLRENITGYQWENTSIQVDNFWKMVNKKEDYRVIIRSSHELNRENG